MSKWLTLDEILNTKAQGTSLIGNNPYMLSHFVTGRLSTFYMTSSWEDNWKLTTSLSWILPYAPLSFVDLNLCLFAEINHKNEHNSFLSYKILSKEIIVFLEISETFMMYYSFLYVSDSDLLICLGILYLVPIESLIFDFPFCNVSVKFCITFICVLWN